MSIKMKDLPESERPYEKLELYGEKYLSNAELLAIIIKSGTKEENSVQIAQRILKLNDKDDLSFLKELGLKQLMQIKGIGKVKAIQIKAMCEFARRISRPIDYRNKKIKNPQDIAMMLYDELKNERREIAKIFMLNNNNNILKIQDISFGSVNFVNVDIKEIINSCINIGATRVILVHNHPTGDSSPSYADIRFTKKLYVTLALVQIDLLDHIVIGNMEYTSIYEYVEELNKSNPEILYKIFNNKDV